MSDSDDSDANIPPREECEARCQEFAEVTGTDSALAMFYLQDRDWDVQRAINAYFEENAGAATAKTEKKIKAITENASSASNQSAETVSQPMQVTDREPHRIRVLSWNIDGLDTNNLATRTKGACKVIKQEKPDVIYLQEVVPKSQELLESECPQYQLIQTHDSGYYTAMMLNCETVMYTDHAISPFYSSKMGRNLLQVKANIKGIECLLITSHLESTKTHAEERTRQLKKAFQEMREAEPKRTVIFGGDLNLRDEEVVKAGGLPDNIYDLWEVTGKRPEAKFTWDCRRNDNTQMPGKFQPRCRFDRLYLRGCQPQRKLKPVYFELVGIERMTDCQRFPSDHWGILAHFDKVT